MLSLTAEAAHVVGHAHGQLKPLQLIFLFQFCQTLLAYVRILLILMDLSHTVVPWCQMCSLLRDI